MAEPAKGVTAGKLAINVQKRFTRAQEKVLQKLGKADETRDVVFEDMVTKFNKQMTEGTKLQKDLKCYQLAVKNLHDASRRLHDCLAEMYEPDWFGKEEMDSLAEELIEKELDCVLEDTDTLWLDYHQNISDQSVSSIDSYLTQFPDIKARIAKRDRKMVDFDSARHHFSSLQKGKKKDEAKIAKPTALLEMAAPSWAQGLISAHQVAQTNLCYNQAEEELGRAQKIFEELNVELQDELPVLWENRVCIYVNTFQNLANLQEKFHTEMSQLSQNLNDIMSKLEEQRQLNEETNHSESGGAETTTTKRAGPPPSRPPPRLTPSPDHRSAGVFNSHTDDAKQDHAPLDQPQYPDSPEATQGGWGYSDHTPQGSFHPSWDNDEGHSALTYAEANWEEEEDEHRGWGGDEEEQGAVTNGSDDQLPPGFLYKVKAVHDYSATDGDELELKVGDSVLVLAFDNPDEQDDGWLLGLKEFHWTQNKNTSAKGVFPENFTQKV